MPILRKYKRLKIYKEMLRRFQSKAWDSFAGFCFMIMGFHNDNFHYNIEDFPELMEYKPTHNRPYWWRTGTRGRNIRIAVLQEIIKEMSKK